jgi:peptidyl-prolyl cis-trans isomerase SurA
MTPRMPRASALPIYVLAGFALLLGGCRWRRSEQREVWAQVNGHPIYRDEVESYYRRRRPRGRDAASDEQALSLKLNLLNELINDQLLLQRAAELRMIVTETEVDHRIAALSSPYSADEFQKKISDEGLTPASLRDQVRQGLLVEKLLDREIRSRIQISPAEIEAYYHRNQAQFNVPETRYHLAQIVVTPSPDPKLPNLRGSDAAGPAAAERRVRLIEKRLRSGAAFAQIAAEYSEDPATVSSGGDMGFVGAAAIASDRRLFSAISALRAGQISGIIRDEKGSYHILKLLGREDAGQRPLSDPEVQKTIRDALRSEREELLKAAYLEDLHNRAKVKDELAHRIGEVAGNPAAVR